MDVNGPSTLSSPFDLARPGPLQDRVEEWCRLIFDDVNTTTDTEILWISLSIEPQQAEDGQVSAAYPKHRVKSDTMVTACKEALRLGRIAIAGRLPDDQRNKEHATSLAIPLEGLTGESTSILSIEANFPSQDSISQLISRMGLCLGWPAHFVQLHKTNIKKRRDNRSIDALKSIASLASSASFSEASRTLVTDLADRFQCDRVALGLARRNSIRLEAISHVGTFKRSMLLSRKLSAAMDEAFDQRAIIMWPNDDDHSPLVSFEHANLAENDRERSLLSIPLFDGKDYVGAMLFEKSAGRRFDNTDIAILETLSTLLTPLLIEKRQNSKALPFKILDSIKTSLKIVVGRTHFGIKLAALACAIAIFLLFYIERPKTVVADAIVEAAETRTISAPFDGFISDVHVSEGDQVAEGTLLLQLDTRELSIERMRLTALMTQAALELDRAISSRNRAEGALVEARMRQIEAQSALIDQQIERSQVKAPFEALVVSGDQTRSVGRAISRGEPLMELAPVGTYRVALSVREQDLSLLQPGQVGHIRLSPIPERLFEISLSDLIPVARYENGSTYFSFEGELSGTPSSLLHGMSGTARIEVSLEPLIILWGKPLLDELKMWLWRNFPI